MDQQALSASPRYTTASMPVLDADHIYKASKDEVDALKGQLSELRLAGESEVRTVVNI